MKFLLSVCVLIELTGICSAVKCYSCSYSSAFGGIGNPNCNQGAAFNGPNLTANGLITECNGQCSKSKVQIGSEVAIYRNCMSPCYSIDAGSGKNSCCGSDYCNTAPRPLTTSALLLCVTMLASVLGRLYHRSS